MQAKLNAALAALARRRGAGADRAGRGRRACSTALLAGEEIGTRMVRSEVQAA